ncbi:MAG: hypothetical protein WC222_12290 [Parachlamydiales bacterium]|jgi:hypothetical protein
MGKLSNILQFFRGSNTNPPPVINENTAPHTSNVQIRPTNPIAPSAANPITTAKPLPPIPQQAVRTNTQATTVLNSGTPAHAAPNPYCATSSATRVQQQVQQNAPTSIITAQNDDPNFCDDVEHGFENFVLDYRLDDLKNFNTTILNFEVKKLQYTHAWMFRVLGRFTKFLVDPQSINPKHTSNSDIKIDEVLNTYSNLILMYNFSSKNQLKVHEDPVLKNHVLQVIEHFKGLLNTRTYNEHQKFLIGIEIGFLEILLTEPEKLLPDSNFYDIRLWDVNAPMIPSDRLGAESYHGVLYKRKFNTLIECVLAIRGLSVVILNRIGAGKIESFTCAEKIFDIYANKIGDILTLANAARMKCINFITEMALRTNNGNMKDRIISLLEQIQHSTRLSKQSVSHIAASVYEIQNSKTTSLI